MNPTPTMFVSSSLWIIDTAASSVYLCRSANASPASVLLISTLSRPITWKSGTMHSARRLGSISGGGSAPRRSTAARIRYQLVTSGEESTWSCVETTAFGSDVVPDVNRISASSSSAIEYTGGHAAPRYGCQTSIISSQSWMRTSHRGPSTHGRSCGARSGRASRSAITTA